MLAEKAIEIGGVLEAERERDLLYGGTAGFQSRSGFLDDALLDQVARRPLEFTAAQGVQSVRRDAKQTSIVGDTQLLVISLLKESAEAAENLGAAALFLGLAV